MQSQRMTGRGVRQTQMLRHAHRSMPDLIKDQPLHLGFPQGSR